MRLFLMVVLVASCTKSEAPPSSSVPAPAPTPPVVSTPHDAPAVAVIDAAAPDAAPDESVTEDRFASVLAPVPADDGARDPSPGPGEDLARQFADKIAVSGVDDDRPDMSGPRGTITFERATRHFTSDRTHAKVLRVAPTFAPTLIPCYQAALRRSREAKGTVLISVTIENAGAASDVEVESFDDALSACVQPKAARWRFPAPARGEHPWYQLSYRASPE